MSSLYTVEFLSTRSTLRGDAAGAGAAVARAGGGGGRRRRLDRRLPGRGRGATYAPDGQLKALPGVRADAADGAAAPQRRRVRGPADGRRSGSLQTAQAAARSWVWRLEQLKLLFLRSLCLETIFGGDEILCRLGAATATTNGKRFLILTYAVEFDRVHYPLPLTQELSPSPEVLQRTIRRLRQELAEKEKTAGNEGDRRLAEENAALKEENRCLKNTLKQYCDVRDANGTAVNSTGELQRELQVEFPVCVKPCC
ncbi:unnamed protein product [Phytophthora lilii]|uniref:Unnamed protein product n=1 Tax=Phytophthora lilii TaxID=2077276 RepID=A0A9W7CR31_9STRA|nr:unnamed protein product [Phytophthora lilii]